MTKVVPGRKRVTVILGKIWSGVNTLDRWQSETLILLTNVDKILLETEFLIDICRRAIQNTVSSIFFSALVNC